MGGMLYSKCSQDLRGRIIHSFIHSFISQILSEYRQVLRVHRSIRQTRFLLRWSLMFAGKTDSGKGRKRQAKRKQWEVCVELRALGCVVDLGSGSTSAESKAVWVGEPAGEGAE